MQQVNSAIAAGTWPTPPSPHLYAWGSNASGQLGLGNITFYSSPKQVGSLTVWSTIANGGNFFAVIKTDGSLWTWGNNAFGQLGQGNITKYSSPKQVGALTNWLKVSAGYGFFLAVKTDNTLWSWGKNSQGQLGLGNITFYSSPMQVGSLTNWLSISCSGYSSALAVKTDGTLWSWGWNNGGQLGLGDITNRSSPVQVGGLTSWSKVTIGSTGSSFAIKTDGTLWSWGTNSYGQLGLSNITNYSSPKQIGALTSWNNVSGSSGFTSAIKTDGTLWSWGYNANGGLGLGNITYYSSPKQVGSLTNWLILSTGYSSSGRIAIKTDGTLWSWGYNGTGQLGLGNATSYSSPKQVGSLTSWSTVTTGNVSSMGIAST
jgi:alpha-tubulin suppressor-like RCC1 family protein